MEKAPFSRVSLVLSIASPLVGGLFFVAMDRQWLPCALSPYMGVLSLCFLSVLALVFHVLRHRKQSLTWGVVLVRVILVLASALYMLGATVSTVELKKRQISVAYALFPGALSGKAPSCFESQLGLGFHYKDEVPFGFTWTAYIGELRTAEGASLLRQKAQEAHYRFTLEDAFSAVHSNSHDVLDTVLSQLTSEELGKAFGYDMEGSDLSSFKPYIRLQAAIHWGTPHVQAKAGQVLMEYMRKRGQKQTLEQLMYRAEDTWVLDLRSLGTVEDLPTEFSYMPVDSILLAPGALKAANDELVGAWAAKVPGWSGPNPSDVAVRELLELLYGDKKPAASEVAIKEKDSVVALRLSSPTQPVDSLNVLSVGLWRFASLREADFAGSRIARKGTLMLYGAGLPLQKMSFAGEKINGMSLVGFEQAQTIDLRNLGLSRLELDQEIPGKVLLSGNRLCEPKMREVLKAHKAVQGLDEQQCKERPMEWDTLLASVARESESLIGMESAEHPLQVSMTIPSPEGSPLWSEVAYMDDEVMEVTGYRLFYPGVVYEGGEAIYGSQFPPLLDGRLKPGMSRGELIEALGEPMHGDERVTGWYTEDVCEEEPWDGLHVGFDDSGIVRWVRMRVASGC